MPHPHDYGRRGRVSDLQSIDSALAVLARAKQRFEAEGYEVQTTRIATSPVVASLSPAARDAALGGLQALDALVESHGALVSIGPVLVEDRLDEALAPWSAELARTTHRLNFSVTVASRERGVHAQAAASAARVMIALAGSTPRASATFASRRSARAGRHAVLPRRAHDGPASPPSARVSRAGAAGAGAQAAASATAWSRTLTTRSPVEHTAMAIAQAEGRSLGIDPSPAPGQNSIGAALEALMHRPSHSSTLEARAARPPRSGR